MVHKSWLPLQSGDYQRHPLGWGYSRSQDVGNLCGWLKPRMSLWVCCEFCPHPHIDFVASSDIEVLSNNPYRSTWLPSPAHIASRFTTTCWATRYVHLISSMSYVCIMFSYIWITNVLNRVLGCGGPYSLRNTRSWEGSDLCVLIWRAPACSCWELCYCNIGNV